MKKELLNFIQCPDCGKELILENESWENNEIKEGLLRCCCGAKYVIDNFIPRFVKSDKYVSSFSFEWDVHRKTQLDSANVGGKMEGVTKRSFQSKINFPLQSLSGKKILDVGCGMGRYAEIASRYGAEVVAVDLSFAVDAAFQNLRDRENVHFIQADIFNLPFQENQFDFVYSFGVLHHTPDCEQAFLALPKFVKQEGRLAIFVYSSYNKGIVYMSEFWRYFTTRIPKKLLYFFSFISVPLYYLYKIPIIGNIGKMFFVIPMWPDWRWRILDTFDWYSPKFQSKHTHSEVFRWFQNSNFKDIFIGENEITMGGIKNGIN